MELSQPESLISSDPSTKGFDLSAGTSWIYPLNYQFREYQYNITKNALFNNTLVCLPTGLGKTLIAAVVMYNFWRWYPRGKIVFLAPTKPLVAQQIHACHDIMGIPSSDTIELTGLMNPKNRQIAWFTKRVIFATPQVFQNDLEKNIASGELVRCVVIDEAHKALGKHAYCESLRILRTQNSCFRVLALSATPGSRIDDVCHIMHNLLISNLELRDETSPDIIPYLNKRQMDIILVPLDKDLARFKEKYVSIMDRYVRLLVQYNILKGDASTISKGRVFYLYKEFQSKTNKPANYGQIMRTISRCMSLYHAYELLIRHGLRAFATFCQTHSADTWMTDEPALKNLLDEILSFLGPFPTLCPLPDGSVEEIPNDLVFGHTKFYKLKRLLLEHFERAAAKNEETRAIVFVEYRDSVNEVYVSLLQLRPTLRPKMFVGQSGQKRKQQMQAMEAFRNNKANVLISTSVGEEGLDVGEVDLIVCFDISQSSPIRLVQRMGRTGRRRDGRIVMLVTDGKEHQALKSTIAKRDSLNKKVLHSSRVISALFQESPRMVPPHLDPVCSKRHIVLQPKTPAGNGKRKRKEKEDDMHKENKKKATVAKSHAVLPGEVEKGKSMQSSMLKFLQKPSTSKEPNEVLTYVNQPSQANKPPMQISEPDSIKLLTSDTAALEFLTLCAIKASKVDRVKDELNRMDETYLAVSEHDDIDNFFDYLVPDSDILNCIVCLEERTECVSPEYIEDFGFDQIDNDVYVPEHNQLNVVEDRTTNNSPAVGNFNYEDLFDDSCESDEMALLDDRQGTILDNNLKVLPDNEESRQHKTNDESKIAVEKLSQDESGNYCAALLEDDYFDTTNIAERLSDQVLDTNKQQCEKEDNVLQIGCFESILDQSSDSDIPSSQADLDMRRNTITQELTPVNYTVSKKQNEVEIQENTNKPSTISANSAVSERQNKIYPLRNEHSKPLTNNLHRADSDIMEMAMLTMNTSKINKSIDVNEQFHCNDRKASYLPIIPDKDVNMGTKTSSRLLTSEHNEPSDSRLRFNFKTPVKDIMVKPENAITNKTNSSDKNVNKYFEESLDEDDDVIFIGEITGITTDNESRDKSIAQPLHEDNDEVVFEKEVSLTEKKKANKSNANSSESTITQILELIENSTSRKINLSKISKNSQSLSNPHKFNPSMSHQSKKGFSLDDKVAPKVESHSTDPFVSSYFSKKDHVSKNVDDTLKTEELLEADLDLSDIKWEDNFASDKEYADCNKSSARTYGQLHSDFRPSTPDKSRTSLLNKEEESFKTNSDGSGIFSECNMQAEKSLPLKTVDLDLGDFEWDSDFETPANPVASLKQFCNSNNTSSPNKSKDPRASESTSKKFSIESRQSTSLSSFAAPMKKKLGTEQSKIFKPSASRGYFNDDDDSDFEDSFFHKLDGKFKTGNDHHPNINYVSTPTKNPLISKQLKWSRREKENTEPNSGLINLSSFSGNRKNKDIRKVPFSREVTTAERKEGGSLDRDSYRRKKYQVRNRIRSEFLDCEAEVSADTSSGTSGEDDDLQDFVSHTQQEPETVDMQGHYLQSIKNVCNRDAFHFKRPRAFVPDDEVFSQPMSQIEESAYIYDSFCVSGGEDDLFTETHEDSLLELTERALNSKKRKRSEKRRESGTRKRSKVEEKSSDSDSSEDETDKLRKQILEESMILKQNKN